MQSPDQPVLTNFLRATAASASSAASSLSSLLEPPAAFRAAEEAAAELKAGGLLPWQTLSEQFQILEPELKARILQLSQSEGNFNATFARQRHREGDILPGCLPAATAVLAADDALRALRFRLVPKSMSEEDFWRSYFWHVAQIKCELCNDFAGTNGARRAAAIEDEQTLALPADEPAGQPDAGPASPPPAAGTPAADDDLDAEFERLVAPSPVV